MDLIFRRPATDVVHQEVNQYGRNLTASLGETHQVAAKYLKTSQETMKKYYDLRVKKEKQPSAGDLVYRLGTATIKGKIRNLEGTN